MMQALPTPPGCYGDRSVVEYGLGRPWLPGGFAAARGPAPPHGFVKPTQLLPATAGMGSKALGAAQALAVILQEVADLDKVATTITSELGRLNQFGRHADAGKKPLLTLDLPLKAALAKFAMPAPPTSVGGALLNARSP
mmetsp:Transcript_21486/g.60488  ORF Transcript_21486/g.60488 Transcript_21486/m.60488 type:complete len:139 (-) Transcript_21486:219-635(-)